MDFNRQSPYGDERIQRPATTEHSISIETSDDDYDYTLKNQLYPIIHDDANTYQNEKSFHNEVNKIQSKSIKRFKNKWDEILLKYSNVDDNRESDEIDLFTGKIITDNGHLRSMKSETTILDEMRIDDNIWSLSYNVDRESARRRKRESRERQRKRELKSKLKSSDTFHNPYAHQSTSQDSFDDDSLLLTPSPVKKRAGFSGYFSSPLKHSNRASPARSPPNDSALSSPTKKKRGNRSALNSFNEYLDRQVNDLRSGFMHDKRDTLLNKESGLNKSDESDRLYEMNESNEVNEESYNIEHVEPNDDNDSLDFSDEFSLVSNSTERRDKSTINIYSCAFENCRYCTGNKAVYRTHLVDKHRQELSSIGYPLSCPSFNDLTIPESSIANLTKHFPLGYEVPRLPDSHNGQPYRCNLTVDGKPCQKVFLTKDELKAHERHAPSLCSKKRQVFLCPMLGCGYMTDEGYLEFRAHFIREKHSNIDSPASDFSFIEPREIESLNEDCVINEGKSKLEGPAKLISDEIDVFFRKTEPRKLISVVPDFKDCKFDIPKALEGDKEEDEIDALFKS